MCLLGIDLLQKDWQHYFQFKSSLWFPIPKGWSLTPHFSALCISPASKERVKDQAFNLPLSSFWWVPLTTGMWQLPIVEHPSSVSTSSRGWQLELGDAGAQRGKAVGTVPSASILSPFWRGLGFHLSTGKSPQNSKEFASATRQCLLLFGLFSCLGQYFFNTLWDGLAAPGTSLAASFGSPGKDTILVSFLKLNF